MISNAEISLWGATVAKVGLAPGESHAIFQYTEECFDLGYELSPVVMPLLKEIYQFPALSLDTFHGLPGLLADSLPDKFGSAVLRTAASLEAGVGLESPIDYLCYTGTRGMGALEYKPSIGPEASPEENLEVQKLVALASDVLNQRKSSQVSADNLTMQQLIQVGTSAGGARAKAIVAWNEATGEVRSGQASCDAGFSHWILKFDEVEGNGDKDGVDCKRYTVIEYAYYLMARAAGVPMAECRLLNLGSSQHFMTRRFDRTDSGQKLHMQTLGALGHFDFNNPGAQSYEDAVNVARYLGLGQVEVEDIFRRMTFNVMASNRDDHVKNLSFLMTPEGEWFLAPAYDVTFAYNPNSLWTGSHQMRINGKREGIEMDDLMAVATNMSIKPQRAQTAIEEVREALTQWETFAEQAGLSEEIAARIKKHHVLLS